MRLLCWNCRGLGNPRTVRDLHHMVIDKKPCFIFLIETLCMHKQMEKIRSLLGFEGLFVMNPVGRSGGLAILWKRKNSLEIFNYSRFHINAVISEEDGSSGWKFTGFYGNPDAAKRSASWDLLRHLKSFNPQHGSVRVTLMKLQSKRRKMEQPLDVTPKWTTSGWL
jgi:hypothetical protein